MTDEEPKRFEWRGLVFHRHRDEECDCFFWTSHVGQVRFQIYSPAVYGKGRWAASVKVRGIPREEQRDWLGFGSTPQNALGQLARLLLRKRELARKRVARLDEAVLTLAALPRE